jgi:hypothetical protein
LIAPLKLRSPSSPAVPGTSATPTASLELSTQGRLAALFGRDNLAACMDARCELPNAFHGMDGETASVLSRASKY